MIAPQMLGGQRRPQALAGAGRTPAAVVLAHQRDDRRPMRVRHRPIGPPPGIPMHQALPAVGAIARSQSLGLPIAHPEQWCRLTHTQFPRDHAS